MYLGRTGRPAQPPPLDRGRGEHTFVQPKVDVAVTLQEGMNSTNEGLVRIPRGLQPLESLWPNQLQLWILQPHLQDPVPQLKKQLLALDWCHQVWEAGCLNLWKRRIKEFWNCIELNVHLCHLVIGNPGLEGSPLQTSGLYWQPK